ncbi:MAG: leucyl/phenylalanyl-tRNA--protein transferase [Actinomycetota bacterium]
MERGHLRQPLHPAATSWSFPAPSELDQGDDLVAAGADLEPGTLLAAYSNGYFPMPLDRRTIGWFHPDPRGIIPLDGLHVSRSLRRSVRRYRTTIDEAFTEVISACADPARPLGWIDHRIRDAYEQLHHMGWAHSIEVWDDDGLAGGLYGVALGGLFAGESMFHRRTDASKVALVHLVDVLSEGGSPERADALLDVQWKTDHLATLGAVEVPRATYVNRLQPALRLGLPSGLVASPLFAPAEDDPPH